MNQVLNIMPMGHQCILIQWEKEAESNVFETRRLIEEKYGKEILETVPTYQELAVYLHLNSDREKLLQQLQQALPFAHSETPQKQTQTFLLPVCYQGDHGLDMDSMSKAKDLSTEEVISLHSESRYRIHFLGFLPGFPYLSGLCKKLHHPRLASPRNQIPAGSVGIAGSQTGVYPRSSPGGWNIIGRTPVPLFDRNQNPPAKLQAGCSLRFVPIDQKEFETIAKAAEKGEYQLEVTDD